EDGIRYLYVTGVQTCALPILRGEPSSPAAGAARPAAVPRCRSRRADRGVLGSASGPHRRGKGAPRRTLEPSARAGGAGARHRTRSEERRVGEERRTGEYVEYK